MTKNIFKPFNNNPNSLLPIGFHNVSLKLDNNYFFNKLSFKINTSGISVFIGANGAGKSTCIRLLIGLLKPYSGRVLFSADNRSVNRIGYVPQKIILLRRSVEKNLLHALSISNYPTNKKRRIKEILKFIKLEHLGKQSARNLSIGQQQLISIMRALAIKPSFLFLDEPCANLDPKTTQIIENLIKVVSKSGVKIIIVTHDLFQAKRLANDVLFFHNGEIIEQGKTNSFFTRPKSKEAKDFQKGLLLK
ncbi:MAG: ATP-binding cassette domain-containing protein [Alphaproteobacteria bacterium]|nr:ATP-binding cassette domain-containing protein [Alphaproteobacteria bacterium]